MAPHANDLFIARNLQILEGRTSLNAISDVFDERQRSLKANEVERTLRQRVSLPAIGIVRWSFWLGNYQKAPTFLSGTPLRESRYAFILVLENATHMGVAAGGGGGNPYAEFGNSPVAFEDLLKFNSDDDTEYDAVATRRMRTVDVGVERSSLAGVRLERSLSRVVLKRSIPTRVRLRRDDEKWSVRLGSGGVHQHGDGAVIEDLCAWFARVCATLQLAAIGSSFIDAFAKPQDLGQVGNSVHPHLVTFDAGLIQELESQGWSLRDATGKAPTPSDRAQLESILCTPWRTVSRATKGANPTWDLSDGATTIGRLGRRVKKMTFSSRLMGQFVMWHPTLGEKTVAQLYNDAPQQFLVSFDDPAFAYYGGQLFREEALAETTDRLIEIIKPDLPATGIDTEKSAWGAAFSSNSIFGYVSSHSKAEFLICEDQQAEWADFIEIDTVDSAISFIHCKYGTTSVGASPLHEVVAQALKNLGFLDAAEADLISKRPRWEGKWTLKGQSVSRLVRGNSVQDAIAAFRRVQTAINAERRVVLVVAGLSRSDISRQFKRIRSGKSSANYVRQLIWLLSFFVDSCTSLGFKPLLVCEP